MPKEFKIKDYTNDKPKPYENVNSDTGRIISGIGRNYQQSDNFVSGVSGWKIWGDGSAEFQNGVFRGSTEDAIIIDHGSDILLKEGGDIKFTTVTAPGALTATLIATGTGNVDNGNHSYKVTYVNSAGETELGTVSNVVTVDGTHKQVALSAIPKSSSLSVTSRNIYRTAAGGTTWLLLTTISDNVTTTYTDNTADVSLTTDGTNRSNATAGRVLIDNENGLVFNTNNTFVGAGSGEDLTTGWLNSFLGYYSGHGITTGYANTCVGYFSGRTMEGDYNNTFIGVLSGYSSEDSNNNIFIGSNSGYSTTTGSTNTFMGAQTGYSNVTGSGNVAIGFTAGYYETGSNSFYVNNQDRTNTAGDKSLSLLYGVFAAAAANQKLTINGLLNQSVSKTPANATDTGTAGDICWDANFIYVCVAANTWKKVAIASW